MTDIRKIQDQVSVAPQIAVTDLAMVKKRGFTTVICNRPDGEEPGQPESGALRKMATDLSLRWIDVPLTPGQLTMDIIAEMADALRCADGPVLAFCRTGTRSCHLWALACAYLGADNPQALVEVAARAGYDITGIAPTLSQLYAAANSPDNGLKAET